LRLHFNLTFAEWEAEFVCAKTPFGKTLDTTSSEHTITSLGTYAGSFVALGNYKPKPKITITFTEVAGVDKIRLRNISTGDWIEVNNANGYVNNDVVEIALRSFPPSLAASFWMSSAFPSTLSCSIS